MHVRMRIGREEYALPVLDVLEVVDRPELTPVPGAPSRVLGVCNLRGTVLPVIDLAAVLGVHAPGNARRVVVAEGPSCRAGLAVDQVIEVSVLPEARESADSAHLSGAVLDGESLVGVVNLRSVLTTAIGAG